MIPGLKTAGLALLALLTVLAWTPVRVEAGGGEHCQETGPMPTADHPPGGQLDCGSPCDPGNCPTAPCASQPAHIVNQFDNVVDPARPAPALGTGFPLHLHGTSPPPTPPPNPFLG